MSWTKKNQEAIKSTVFEALDKNKNFMEENILGIPGSYLDSKVFSQDDRILDDAPFLSSLVKNPNHIGCHTLGKSESFFSGTQELEREVISICSEDILKAEKGSCDGYVASGGTEANIQAIWIYRNYFLQKENAKHGEIAILCSEDSHYSMHKAANLLNISIFTVPVGKAEKELTPDNVRKTIKNARIAGMEYFIVVANMMTTMFGSVDDYRVYVEALEKENLPFKMHVDAAFGGFYYPFSNKKNDLNFYNKYVTSVTMDAHKMAQAPYGTGIFLIRKGYMQLATTEQASYVEGEDSTLIGSRSGANAIAIWMILSKYGPNGWIEKIFILQKRTDWLCEKLNEQSITYYRNSNSNIVAIGSKNISEEIAEKYGLVPDNHTNPEWYKIVVMDHVSVEKIELFMEDMKRFIPLKPSIGT